MGNTLLHKMCICAKSGEPEAMHHRTTTQQRMGSEKLEHFFSLANLTKRQVTSTGSGCDLFCFPAESRHLYLFAEAFTWSVKKGHLKASICRVFYPSNYI